MSLETDIKLGSLERGRMRYFPVVPGRVEFAAAMLKQFNAKQREEFEAQRLRDAARSHGQQYPH